MANRTSIQARHATRLRSAALRAPILKPIPMLLAAVLVGCASSGHHTTGALTQQPAKPISVTSPAAPSAVADEEMPPTIFKDEGGEANNESPARPERFEDDPTAQDDDGSPSADRFADETGNTPPEENFAQRPFVADEAPPADEAVVAQRFTDDSGPAKDEAVVAPEQFTDDTPAVKNEGVAHERFTDDSAPAMDDDIAAHQQFTDETPVVKDEAVATEEYTDDATPAAPEQFVRTPEHVTERTVAEAHETKARPATMLPMTVTVEADPLFDFDRDSIGAEARKKLDELIQQLKGIPYGEVITLGYADPIGTEAYNQKLSERRAASVSRYLVSRGIPADKIRVEARGETEEFATYKGCKGQGKQKLIDCLQADRRVEVTVTTAKDQ
jgi:outer membrane protein OmpA-like peptidoglycan-associated protein